MKMMPRLLCCFVLLALAACGSPAPTSVPVQIGTVPPVATQVQAETNPAGATQPPVGTPAASYSAAARAYIQALTAIGPRIAGTDAEAQAAEYIADALNGMGYSAETKHFSGKDVSGNQLDSANVVAVKPGKSPRVIVVGAHYDSVAVGKGADDNASGVAVLLEVADLLKNEATPYTIQFVAFGAEESGLVGSYAYVNQMTQADFENVVAMINMDSLIAGDVTYVYGDEQQAALRDWTLEWAFGNGFDLQTIHNADLTDGHGMGVSDFSAFHAAGIPYIYFEATNWDLGAKDGYTQVDPKYGVNGEIWHTADDTLEYLDATFPGRVDQHLNLYVPVLYNILTQYEAQP
ncbi:MAG TPA: M20/M25/M40 family metallo-hydrolase [Anaerolineales bacterium]|nr:M20/M25/M40 family metallo-hydrolase [Anaerolineales bacterium]